MSGRFDGKTAIVTGAGSGIGKAVALKLGREGANVVVADISPDGGEATVSEIREAGGSASFAQGDVTVAADAERIVAEAVGEFGQLNVLANVAGGSVPQWTVVDMPEDEWHYLVDFNLKSVYIMSKFAIPKLLVAGGGAIVNVSSGAGVSGMPLNPAYCAAKGGVIALTKAMAIDHGPEIRVNCVSPGAVMTPLMRANRTPEEIAGFAKLNLLNKLGEAEELADSIVYLASDEATFITAQTINVDGGANRA